jgi:hypothetical protein
MTFNSQFWQRIRKNIQTKKIMDLLEVHDKNNNKESNIPTHLHIFAIFVFFMIEMRLTSLLKIIEQKTI